MGAVLHTEPVERAGWREVGSAERDAGEILPVAVGVSGEPAGADFEPDWDIGDEQPADGVPAATAAGSAAGNDSVAFGGVQLERDAFA